MPLNALLISAKKGFHFERITQNSLALTCISRGKKLDQFTEQILEMDRVKKCRDKC